MGWVKLGRRAHNRWAWSRSGSGVEREMNEGDDSMEREKWGSARLMDRRIVDRIEDDEDGEPKFGRWLQELEGEGG
ncbi:hypothetical protein V6N12_010672 [Hibiscus sabdariffa]|uniref:Uncharacterized protein n=1 Tax=Hibiscus sabdariffa TaxID=183260 RepID=A0ABR2EKT1_9ROSI